MRLSHMIVALRVQQGLTLLVSEFAGSEDQLRQLFESRGFHTSTILHSPWRFHNECKQEPSCYRLGRDSFPPELSGAATATQEYRDDTHPRPHPRAARLDARYRAITGLSRISLGRR